MGQTQKSKIWIYCNEINVAYNNRDKQFLKKDFYKAVAKEKFVIKFHSLNLYKDLLEVINQNYYKIDLLAIISI